MKKHGTKTLTITSILTLTIAMLMATVPTVSAKTIDTYSWIHVGPNPVGINQTVTVFWWIVPSPPLTTEFMMSGMGWENVTVMIKKPGGNVETKGPFTSASQGTGWFTYVPDQLGEYTFQMHFPGQTITYDGFYFTLGVFVPCCADDSFKPYTSKEVSLIVQEEQIEKYQPAELPAGYWERPIYSENREWSQIAGNWLGLEDANLYSKAPETPHIVWTKEHGFGGIIGAEYGPKSYYTGLFFHPRLNTPVIIQGRLYYNSLSGPFSFKGITCVDIRTGEELWSKDGVFATIGQIYYEDIGDIHGGLAFLWDMGPTWRIIDASTGEVIRELENAPIPITPSGFIDTRTVLYGNVWGKVVYGPNGEILVYLLNDDNNWLARWNSTAVKDFIGYETGMWQWSPKPGPPIDWRTGIDMNVTIPDVPGSPDPVATLADSGIIYARALFIGEGGKMIAQDTAYNQTTGEQLWGPINRTAMPSVNTMDMSDGVFVDFTSETQELRGYSAKTGELLWTSYTLKHPLDQYICYTPWAFATEYGKLYVPSYSGHVYAFDLKTGKMVWSWFSGSSGYETPTGVWELHGRPLIADGKVYIACSDMEPFTPMWRGYSLVCVDAETGTELWRISGDFQVQSYSRLTIADGYLVGFNMYDNQIYSFGKGPTATEVSASPKIIADGASVLIEGRVTDRSPGAKDTPAIADEYMSEWMEHLYMQKPAPMDIKGVDVMLQARSSNGTITDIDWVTSDAYGCFSYKWTPPDEDVYAIMATFMGSKSYWPSYAQTGLGVTAAPPALEEAEAPAYTTIDLVIIAAVVVAICLVVYTLYTVRKQRK